MTAPSVYMIAGEPSGDRLGAGLIEALSAHAPGLRLHGVGGRGMRETGLEPLFGIEDLAVMGIAEVLPKLPTILRLMRRATDDVLATRPDVLVTIDAPSFALRVAARVRRADPSIRTVHYVAPSVWAWRPGRAAHMARFTDQVLCLLPFEPPLMEAAGMRADFVGHPVADRAQPSPGEIRAFRERLGPVEGERLLLLAPGSRRGEVARMMPPMAGALEILARSAPPVRAVLPVAETVAEMVEPWAEGLPVPVHLVRPEEGERMKHIAFAAADAAIATSGTVALELAAAGTPHVSIYRANWATAAVVRRLLRVDTAHLVNLVLARKVVPECLQEACTPERIANAAAPLLAGKAAARRQTDAFAEALAVLGRGAAPGSERAAAAILDGLARRGQYMK